MKKFTKIISFILSLILVIALFPFSKADSKIIPGTVEEIEISKKTLYVYLPYNYDASQKYDIYYHQLGVNSTDNQMFNLSSCKKMLDTEIFKGNIKPFIMVIIPDKPIIEEVPELLTCKEEETLELLEKPANKVLNKFDDCIEIMQTVEETYSTYADTPITYDTLKSSSNHRAIGGFSQGAYRTWECLSNSKIRKLADIYIPASPVGVYKSGEYQNYAPIWDKTIDALMKEKGRIKVFNSIGSEEEIFKGLSQLNDTLNIFEEDGFEFNKNVYGFIVEDQAHSYENDTILLKNVFKLLSDENVKYDGIKEFNEEEFLEYLESLEEETEENKEEEAV